MLKCVYLILRQKVLFHPWLAAHKRVGNMMTRKEEEEKVTIKDNMAVFVAYVVYCIVSDTRGENRH